MEAVLTGLALHWVFAEYRTLLHLFIQPPLLILRCSDSTRLVIDMLQPTMAADMATRQAVPEQRKPAPIEILPDDVLTYILDELDLPSLVKMEGVSRAISGKVSGYFCLSKVLVSDLHCVLICSRI